MTAINVSEENTAFASLDGVLYNKDLSSLILYPISKQNISFVMPNTVTKVEPYAFSLCTNLNNITISNSMIMIGDYAFINCSSLNSVTIPNSVTTIGNNAFNHCI